MKRIIAVLLAVFAGTGAALIACTPKAAVLTETTENTIDIKAVASEAADEYAADIYAESSGIPSAPMGAQETEMLPAMPFESAAPDHTEAPTQSAAAALSAAPSAEPSQKPSSAPTEKPAEAHTEKQTAKPTSAPKPTAAPASAESPCGTVSPVDTPAPTSTPKPTTEPTETPVIEPGENEFLKTGFLKVQALGSLYTPVEKDDYSKLWLDDIGGFIHGDGLWFGSYLTSDEFVEALPRVPYDPDFRFVLAEGCSIYRIDVFNVDTRERIAWNISESALRQMAASADNGIIAAVYASCRGRCVNGEYEYWGNAYGFRLG